MWQSGFKGLTFDLPSVFIDETFRVKLVRIDKVLWVVHDEGDVGHEVGAWREGVRHAGGGVSGLGGVGGLGQIDGGGGCGGVGY